MNEDDFLMRIYCGKCHTVTNQKILKKAEESSLRVRDEWPESWREHYFCQCAGCEAYSYAVAEYDEADFDPEIQDMTRHWTTYPHAFGSRSLAFDEGLLPLSVSEVYSECVQAFNANLNILAAVGLRALIELICKQELNEDRAKLEKLIGDMEEKRLLSKTQAATLHSLRFMGNAAAHKVQRASRAELLAALEIAESMLNAVYILPDLRSRIRTGQKNNSASGA